MMQRIPYARQNINQDDIQTVIQVLQSDFLTQGPAVERFEQAVAAYCGAKYAVAVNSATSGLHIACMAAGLGSGDILWTSPNTFVASANCGLYCGATADFVDIDPRTYNLSVAELAEKLNRSRQQGTLPKVVIPVDFSGQSCEMKSIRELAKEYGFTLIEDASHAIGGCYQDNKVGSCQFSDMTVLSFHPVKIITTAEGGMVLTNREDLYEKLLLLRSHGITRNPAKMVGDSHGPWYYQQVDLGFNYRLTDLQAALGCSQLQRIDEFVARRQVLAARYNQALSRLPLTIPYQHPDAYSAYHLYVIRLHTGKLRKTRRQIFEELVGAGINVNLHYIPVHTQPYYQRLGFKPGDFPRAEQYYQEAISLPMYFGLTDAMQDRVIQALQEAIQ
ncbi:UDP-4-keto-6-deoxy-N-acetylglucosamine 4-aminotransferase [Acetonema longum DSM 6540]|uniref:UDP-4-keto-6-deoxy-N-acetylglucosamine 4-aminotransferase n=2 Tax=Acetonema TaxID=2373 RepID=F7NNV3_9FIRM|nr:UDP-4-keto-6-deoxy-N-acetylglucosamine 4-aminotransferase [Acetonema longum DSM 6540]